MAEYSLTKKETSAIWMSLEFCTVNCKANIKALQH